MDILRPALGGRTGDANICVEKIETIAMHDREDNIESEETKRIAKQMQDEDRTVRALGKKGNTPIAIHAPIYSHFKVISAYNYSLISRSFLLLSQTTTTGE